MGFLKSILGRKCKFAKSCPYYSQESDPCEYDGGDYYGAGRKAGCYVDMAEKENKQNKQNKK